VQVGDRTFVDFTDGDVVDGVLCEVLEVDLHAFGGGDDLVGVDRGFLLLDARLLRLLE
jgi:hypothetical protein